ncbi:uncharacterized protein LOC113316467 [Papaver somniferum]|uniref:uncharacterized protein LOC113316467 n=1 Tax=Papaver somniferum TaxID=3469 RepID=UPI000E6FE6BA|nr:uncharacterized protein LOC113316467 [Papaver somniferum]
MRSLKTKHGPRTAVGRDYSWQSDAHRHRPPAPIQKFDGVDHSIRGEEILSVAYGPFYRSWDKEMWKILKEKTWNHVLKTSKTDKDKILTDYYAAIKKVEEESRDLYGRDESIDLLSSHDFIMMMIYDGCFILQVALSVLGGFKRLDHLRDFQLLIPGPNKKTTTMIKVAVSSMFVIGNQVPLLVLKELVKQDFFRNFVRQGIWEEPSDLERWVLYELLVPLFRGGERDGTIIQTDSLLNYLLGKRKRFWSFIPSLGLPGRDAIGFQWKNKHPSENATDLIHGFWLLLTGLDDSMEDSVCKDVDRDGRHTSYSAVPDCHGSNKFVLPTVRSATELKEAGVDFRYKGSRTKINGIRFRNNMFNATLFLPRIIMVSENQMHALLYNLIRYEARHFGESKRKVCEYLQLMRGLVRSADDAKVLMADGIIVVHPDDLEEKVLGFFQKLDDIPQLRSHRNLMRNVKDDLNNYTKPSPFKKLGDVLNFVVFLTIIQSAMSLISYFYPKK